MQAAAAAITHLHHLWPAASDRLHEARGEVDGLSCIDIDFIGLKHAPDLSKLSAAQEIEEGWVFSYLKSTASFVVSGLVLLPPTEALQREAPTQSYLFFAIQCVIVTQFLAGANDILNILQHAAKVVPALRRC